MKLMHRLALRVVRRLDGRYLTQAELREWAPALFAAAERLVEWDETQ